MECGDGLITFEFSEFQLALLDVAGVATKDIVDVYPGYNRLVVVKRDGNVVKVKLMPFADAVKHMRRIYRYHKELQSIGVGVPSFVRLQNILDGGIIEKFPKVIPADKKGRREAMILVEQSKFLGKELGAMIRDQETTPKKILALVRLALEQIFKPLLLVDTGSTDSLNIGLDPLARNIVMNGEEDQLYYVDLFPAKIETGGHKHLEYPEPPAGEARNLGILRHYRKRGILYVFFVDLCRMRPDLRAEFRRVIEEFVQEDESLAEQGLLKYFDESPTQEMTLDVASNVRILQETTGRGISYFHLREIACVLAAQDSCDAEFISLFFHTTHFQSESLSDVLLERLRGILIKLVADFNADHENAFADAKETLREIVHSE